jgi:hypothetical protein
MSPYNPNSIWTSKDNPNLPRKSRSVNPHQQPQPAKEPVTTKEVLGKSKPEPEKPREPLTMGPIRKRSFLSQYGLWLFGGGLIVIIMGIIGLIYALRPPAKPATVLTMPPPNGVQEGTPFVLAISAANDSNVTLSGAVLTMQVPQGVEFVGSDATTHVQEFSLGDMAPGAVVTQSSTLIVTGQPDTLYALSSKLLYTTANTPSTTYETDQATSFSAGPSPVLLTYAGPTNIVSGQSFPITINYQNAGAQNVANAQITLGYPSSSYTFFGSSIPVATGTGYQSSSGGVWNLGTLSPGQGGSFTVTGSIVGSAQSQYQFNGALTTNIDGEQYVVNAQPVNLSLIEPPLSLGVTLNNTTNYVAGTDDTLGYTLTYTNNSSVSLGSVRINAALSGQMFNFSTLQTDGSFNSQNNTITWYAANTPGLTSLAPGQSGSVTFSVKTQSTYPIRLPSDKDFSLGVTGSIASPTVIPGASGTSTVSVVTASNKVGGAIALATLGYLKSGPYPPKVNQATTYTIKLEVTNYSTDVQNVTVTGYLESGTTLVGIASSTQTTSTPAYNAGTGEITWTIPYIPAGTGITDAPVTASFTVTNTPAVNQVNKDVTLVGTMALTGMDEWTGSQFSTTANALTTALPNDTQLGNQTREVTE